MRGEKKSMETHHLSDSGEPVATEINFFDKEFMNIWNNFRKEIISSPLETIIKTVYDLRNYRMLKNVKTFMLKLKDDKITAEDLQKHFDELRLYPNLQEEEQEQLIFMLESHSREIQSLVLAKFYEALLNKEINVEQFLELAEVNRRMFAEDYVGLWVAGMGGIPWGTKLKRTTYSYQKERLVGLGILEKKPNIKSGTIISAKDFDPKNYIYEITNFGNTFYQYSQDEKLLNKYFYDNE